MADTSMPDGSFPISTGEHIDTAIMTIGLATNNSKTAIRKHIMRRAKALGMEHKIPDGWRADGTVAKSDAEIIVPIWKDDHAAEQLVYGVVLAPDLVDSQGDTVTAPEIEKAAHRYLIASRKSDVQHDGQPAATSVVESYIASQDLTVAGQPVTKGSWVLATHIADPELWQRVSKGELTGYSIGGTGVRNPD